MRVALYARVSTVQHQSPESQLHKLRSFCVSKGYEIAEEIVDHGYSGRLSEEKRPGFKQLMKMARSRQVDGVIVLKLDRLARSVQELIRVLNEFVS